jgi:hypothetical protein
MFTKIKRICVCIIIIFCKMGAKRVVALAIGAIITASIIIPTTWVANGKVKDLGTTSDAITHNWDSPMVFNFKNTEQLPRSCLSNQTAFFNYRWPGIKHYCVSGKTKNSCSNP